MSCCRHGDNAGNLIYNHRMGNIFGVNPVLFIGAIVVIVLSVGAWALYEIGKEQGRKGK